MGCHLHNSQRDLNGGYVDNNQISVVTLRGTWLRQGKKYESLEDLKLTGRAD